MRGIGIVDTEYGQVRGVEQNGITVFRSLPFAKAPVGELRFRAPRPCDPWEEVRDCVTFGNIPWQPEGWVGGQTLKQFQQDEDCLTLNIWTPAQGGHEMLPVLVWIHGGGFMGGVSHEALFDGTQFAKRGVILVSISYRLGAFGFLSLPELREEGEGSGNFGLQDQIFALKWIKKNIRAFGGDPAKITIAGQSAGAMSVSSLLASPLTKGLIAGAIMESSGPIMGRSYTTEESEKIGLAFMKAAGAGNLAELRALPPEKLRDISATPFAGRDVHGLLFTPVLDGRILPMQPRDAFVKGEIANVPMIMGSNADEGPRPMAPSADKETALRIIREGAPDFLAGFEKLYAQDPGRTARIADGVDAFLCHRQLFHEMFASACAAEVYHYYFSRPIVLPDGTDIGAPHSIELFFVFNSLSVPEGATLNEGDYSQGATVADHLLAENMQDYWAAFAKYGTPNAPGLAAWNAAKDGSFMHFDNVRGVLRKELKLDALRYWKSKLQ